MATKSESVKVAVRVRTLNSEEIKENDKSVIKVDHNRHKLFVESGDYTKRELKRKYEFDYIFDATNDQNDIYRGCVSPIVRSVLNGYNGTIFVYGQTGTGKTYTMEGDIENNVNKGIMPRAFEHIMEYTNNNNKNIEFSVHISYLEIHNEQIYDLLNKNKGQKMVVKEGKNGFYVKDLSIHSVKSIDDIFEIFKKGQSARVIGMSAMNSCSSRSHCILTINISNNNMDIIGQLNLVDLAGFDRQKKTKTISDNSDERKFINSSLLSLGNVINALSNNKTFIPYRDSKLTRLLSNSLGGKTKTLMIANISPSRNHIDESVSTLRYANYAKNIQNKPAINNNILKSMNTTKKKAKSSEMVEIKNNDETDTKNNDERQMIDNCLKKKEKADDEIIVPKQDGENCMTQKQLTPNITSFEGDNECKWECKTCTFINKSTENIFCEICGATQNQTESMQQKQDQEKISCSVEPEKNGLSASEIKLIADTYYYITQQLITAINNSKNRLRLLKTITHVSGPDKHWYDNRYRDDVKTTELNIRLDFDFDEWMRDKIHYQSIAIGELSQIFDINPKEIKITDYQRGSVIMKIQICIASIWARWSMRNVHQSPLWLSSIKDSMANMRAQDQMQIYVQSKWYDATITKIIDDGNNKSFQVRYNPLKLGEDPFWWNTEWFYGTKEASRWRFHGSMLYTKKNEQGEELCVLWRSPELVKPLFGVNSIEINDHIFGRFEKEGWSRCVVYQKRRNGKGEFVGIINIKSLKSGQKKEVDLWRIEYKNWISFEDMRDK